MKRMLLLFGVLAILLVTISSCAATKRDCNGNKKTRLANGIWI
ncbi:MAG: hypothetical protein ACXWB9_11560 [Flavisolibacter sp.]